MVRALSHVLDNGTHDIALALCSLVCASLTEDRYGVVQRDIPRILEALLSYLTAIEDYQAEIIAKNPVPSPEELNGLSAKEAAEKQELAYDIARAGQVLSEVADRKCLFLDTEF